MFRIKILCLIASAAFIFFGCSREFKAESIELGSNISNKGLISENGNTYNFKFDKTGSMKDLFNYIYFEGDTVCFSADFTQDIQGEPSVYFVDPNSGIKIKAERIEKAANQFDTMN